MKPIHREITKLAVNPYAKTCQLIQTGERDAMEATKRPWTIELREDRNPNELTIITESKIDGAQLLIAGSIYSPANARLIAAAPDLLEACQDAYGWLSECLPGTHQSEIALKLKAALAKVRPAGKGA